MEAPRKLFVISFRSLLQQIADELGLREPFYGKSDVFPKKAYVRINNKYGRDHFEGSEDCDLGDSMEDAARSAVIFFVIHADLSVEDVNLEKVDAYIDCAAIYGQKWMEERRLLGLSWYGPKGTRPKAMRYLCFKTIKLDFKELLRTVLTGLGLSMIDQVTTEVQGGGFESCGMLTNVIEKSEEQVHFVRGSICGDILTSEMSLAKAVIFFLKDLYNFEVIDANHYMLAELKEYCLHQRLRYVSAKMDLEAAAQSAYDSPPHTGSMVKNDCPPPLPAKKRMRLERLADGGSTSYPKRTVVLPSELGDHYYRKN